MFSLTPNPTFWAKAAISIPGGDPAEIEVQFRHKGRAELAEYFQRLGTLAVSDVDAVAEIVADWRGVDQPYSKEALATLVDRFPAAARDLLTAYNRELMESRRKN